MKTTLLTILSICITSFAWADAIYVDQINDYWAYVCRDMAERWTCKDIHAGALERDYQLRESIDHGWIVESDPEPAKRDLALPWSCSYAMAPLHDPGSPPMVPVMAH